MHPRIVYSDSGSRGFHGLQCHGIHNKQTLRLHIEAGAKSQFMILFSRHPDPATGNAPVFAVVERGDSIPARMVGPRSVLGRSPTAARGYPRGVGTSQGTLAAYTPEDRAWSRLLFFRPRRQGPFCQSHERGPVRGLITLKCTTFNASAASFGANG
jgi:hypothetical protein